MLDHREWLSCLRLQVYRASPQTSSALELIGLVPAQQSSALDGQIGLKLTMG